MTNLAAILGIDVSKATLHLARMQGEARPQKQVVYDLYEQKLEGSASSRAESVEAPCMEAQPPHPFRLTNNYAYLLSEAERIERAFL